MHRPPKVLVVDDDRDNRKIYAEYLRYCGFRVTEAATGTAALGHARRAVQDIVVLDLRLPDLDGVEVSRRLGALRASRPPVIALSASTLEGDEARALMRGCDLFLMKPCLPETLESEIRRLLAA